jgi:hypothetical protein
MFVFVFLFCVVLCRYRPLRRANHSSEGVLGNLECEVVKVLTRTVGPHDDDDDDDDGIVLYHFIKQR